MIQGSEAPEISGGSRAEVIARARELMEQGSYQDAPGILERITSGSNLEAGDGIWGLVAACYRKAGKSDQLGALKERLATSGRPNIQVILQTGLAFAGTRQVDAAVAELDAAFAEYGSNEQADILRVKAGILSEADRHVEAIDCVAKAKLFSIGTPYADRWARFSLALAERKRDQATLSRTDNTTRLEAYWRERRDAVYIHVCRQLIKVIGSSAQVVADIGSNRTPTLDFFPGSPTKYSVDPGSPYDGADVIPVREDFFHWNPPTRVQVVSCLQVMEHVENVRAFAARLLELGEVVLISVPFMEPPGLNEGHVHSRIKLESVEDWFGRKPNYHFIAKELSGAERIVCVFDTTTTAQWLTLCDHCVNGLAFKYRWSTAGSSVGNLTG